MWQAFQTAPGGPWSAWVSQGQPAGLVISDVWIASNADGRLELFAVTSDGNLWHRWQKPAGGWSAWTNRSRPAGQSWVFFPSMHAG